MADPKLQRQDPREAAYVRACEGILRSHFGRRPCSAAARAIEQLARETRGEVAYAKVPRPSAWEVVVGLMRRQTLRWATAAAAIALVVGLFLFSPGGASRQDEIGRIAKTVGTPQLGQHATSRAAEVGSIIHMGDRLETGDADKAEIVFRDGTTLRLGFNTAIEIPRPTAPNQDPQSPLSRPAEINLLRGQVWTKVQKSTQPPQYAIRTEAARAIARGTEFGVQVKRPTTGVQGPRNRSSGVMVAPMVAVLTVKEGIVEFTNSLGSVQASTMTESTASEIAAPTEPRRLQTLQTLQVSQGATWSLTTSPLDWPDAARKLVGRGGTLGWQLRDDAIADGEPASSAVRVVRLDGTSAAAQAGVRVGDILVAVDGQTVAHAAEVQRNLLTRSGTSVSLRIGRQSGGLDLALVVPHASSPVSGPELDVSSAELIRGLLQQWSASPWSTLKQAAERGRIEEVLRATWVATVRGAAFNNLGVLFELEDALGPAVRAYGRAVQADPSVPLYRFNLGLALRKIGSFERAAEELSAAVELEGEPLEARMRLVEVRSLLGQHVEALALTEKILEAAPLEHGAWELKSQLLLKLGSPAEAIAPALRATELMPSCAVAWDYLAQAYQASGRLAEAKRAYGEAIALAPFEAALALNLGTLHLERGEVDAAETAFRRALELRPDFALAYRNLGEALAARQALTAAASAFETAAQLDPSDAEALARFGDLALQRRQLAQAERAYSAALDAEPHHSGAWYGLGETRRRQGRSADAERAYRRAIEIRPGDAAPHVGLGIALYDRGEVEEPERLYRRAIALNAKEPSAYHNLGNLYREAHRNPDAAEQWFSRALELSPKDGESLCGLALVAKDRGDLAEAELLLRQAVELAPDSSNIHNNLGEVLRQRGFVDEAYAQYRKAIDLDPDDPAPYGNVGILQAERGRFAEAESMFRVLVERSTGSARLPALVNLASVCAEQGKLEEAEGHFRQALAQAPRHPRVAQSLAAFLADHERKLEEALRLANQALAADPDNPLNLGTLGWVEAQRGEAESAERNLRRALEAAGTGPVADEIRKHLTILLQRRKASTP